MSVDQGHLNTTYFEQGLLTYLGLKEALLERGVTRTDPISPPDGDSPFADLLAWQLYHLVHNLGNIRPEVPPE